MATPGYRSRQSFSGILEEFQTGQPANSALVSLTEGSLTETGAALDVALNGSGFFVLDGGPAGALYTRNGQFSRSGDGRIVGLGGRALQAAGGGDIVAADGPLEILADGSVLQGGRVLARIAVAEVEADALAPAADGLFSAPEDAVRSLDTPTLQQGFLESSNVVLGNEMIGLMEATRRAETGQRLMNLYDDLMGRALTTFGQANG